jgi:heptosyltransferase III
MNRILVIRGGAIGDFILTLPALRTLRQACPNAHIEILGYRHIAALAENRFYAQAVRSIEYGPLSGFFAKNSELPAELAGYFGSFDLIITYLYDPDCIFENNLRRCGVKNLLCGPAKIVKASDHAARQLARPIEELGIRLVDLTEKIFLSEEDRQFGREFLQTLSQPIIAIHPGSGSKEKNWPLQNWIELFSAEHWHIEKRHSLIVISGEADKEQTVQLERTWKDREIRFAKNLPLLIWPGCLSTQSSSATTAESRTWPRLQAQIAFCCSVRPIPTSGRPGTRMLKCFVHQPAKLMTWRLQSFRQL